MLECGVLFGSGTWAEVDSDEPSTALAVAVAPITADSVVNGGGLDVRRLQDVVVSLIRWRAPMGSPGPDGGELVGADVTEFDSGRLGVSPEERDDDGDTVEETGAEDDGLIESE